MRMAQNERPQEQQKSMNSLPSASQMWAPCPVHEQRRTAHRFECPNGRVHTARKQGLRFVKQSRGGGALKGCCHFSAKLAQHEELPTLEAARELDSADPLSRFRERFHIPQHSGADAMYFTGNSLGLQPKAAREALEVELEDWARLGVEGHFQGRNPWVSYHERFVEGLCHLTGAQPHEVVAMNGLTVNLHLLLISFYQPKGQRRKLLCEAKPSQVTAMPCAAKSNCTAATPRRTSSSSPP